MAFLVPLFLAGLAALAVPLLVHLRHKERKQPVRFPSLMFLRRVQFREVSRQQIHHWPLFLLRCLAVALLVVAFARPFLRERGVLIAPATRQGRDLVVLLDRSASMGFGTQWSRAVAAARAALDGLGGGDRAALVLFDAVPHVAVAMTGDRTLLNAGLDQASPSSRPTRLAPALREAREQLLASDRPELEVVLISDFQRAGWQGEVIEPLPEGTVLHRADVSSAGASNLALVQAEILHGEQGIVVTAQVLATGAAAPRRATARLELDGRAAGSAELALSERQVATVHFPAVPRTSGNARGMIRMTSGDSLAVDDVFHFVARPERPLRVFIRRRPGTGNARPFLDRALALSRRPRVDLALRTGELSAADLRDADVVILDDLPFPAGGEGGRLAAFVAGGGGLLHLLGPAAAGAWPAALGGLRATGVVERREVTGGTIGMVRREHPVFEPFRAPGSGDFAATRVYRYRGVAADSLEVLARYDDGAPALLEAPATAERKGRALALTTGADNVWTDLPLQPLFLPLMHQLVLYAGRHTDAEAAQPVGEVAAFGADRLAQTGAVVVVSPAGERTRHEVGPGGVRFSLEEAGFYEVREARSGGRLLELVAANPSPDEADLAAFDPADLVVATGARDSARSAGIDPLDAATLTAIERERNQSLWWFALAAVLVLLAVELLLANRLTGFVRVEPAVSREGP